jgi:stage V sporulation protein B
MQIDLALLGRFLSEGAAGSQGAAETHREAVKQWLAIYKECQTFAFLPYQLLFSVTLILFPMVARAHAESDRSAVRVYVQRGARLAAIFAGLLVGIVVAMPESCLSFAYGSADALKGAGVLRTMALAQGAFAMLGIATTVLTSIGQEKPAALLTFGAVFAVGIACAALVPLAPFGYPQLVRSAEASGCALLASLALASVMVRRRAGAFVSGATALRVGLAVAACLALGFALPRFGRWLTPVAAAGVGLVYLALLVATGEIGAADRAMLASLLRARKQRA